MAKKTFVLDTNVLLENPNCITDSFEDNDLVIPMVVIEEIDHQKHLSDTLGFCAREVSRKLEEIRGTKTTLFTGIPRNNKGGMLRIMPIRSEAGDLNHKAVLVQGDDEKVKMKPGMDLTIVDNLIILTALKVKEENKKNETVLLSNDSNVRIKAAVLGIKSQEYREAKVDDKSLAYTGMRTIKMPLSFFGKFDDKGDWQTYEKLVRPLVDFEEYEIEHNEFVLFVVDESEDTNGLAAKELKKMKNVYRRMGDSLVLRPLKFKGIYGGLMGKNLEQSCAMDLLMDDNIKVVTLKGVAGCVTPDTLIRIRIKSIDKKIPIIDERKI